MQYLFALDALAVTPQVDVSRHRAFARGTKRARDAGGLSTGQTHTHTHTHTPTHTHKSCRVSRVGGDTKPRAHVGLQPHVLRPIWQHMQSKSNRPLHVVLYDSRQVSSLIALKIKQSHASLGLSSCCNLQLSRSEPAMVSNRLTVTCDVP